MRFFLILAVIFLYVGCREQAPEWTPPENALFTRLRAPETGIVFENALDITDDFDVFRYRNFYNGGGVGIGDFNSDGLADIYMVSNMGDNKLFLNMGNWKFEDITEKAG